MDSTYINLITRIIQSETESNSLKRSKHRTTIDELQLQRLADEFGVHYAWALRWVTRSVSVVKGKLLYHIVPDAGFPTVRTGVANSTVECLACNEPMTVVTFAVAQAWYPILGVDNGLLITHPDADVPTGVHTKCSEYLEDWSSQPILQKIDHVAEIFTAWVATVKMTYPDMVFTPRLTSRVRTLITSRVTTYGYEAVLQTVSTWPEKSSWHVINKVYRLDALLKPSNIDRFGSMDVSHLPLTAGRVAW